MMKAAIQELNWEILPHSPYSPDLAPSDYHLFCSLSPTICMEFPSTTALSSKTGLMTLQPNWLIASSVGLKTYAPTQYKLHLQNYMV
jgi:hypothetical protein